MVADSGMSEGGELGLVAVVDPDGRLDTVVEGIERGGIESVRTVEGVAALSELPTRPVCVLVPEAPATETDDHSDGVATMAAVRERLGDVPVGIYVLDGDQDTLVRVLDAGADTVIRVPPERTSVLASRIRDLAGDEERAPLEQRYESLLNHYPEAVYLKDTQSRFVDNTSYAFTHFDPLPVTRDQLVGLTDWDLFDRGLADELFEEEQELMARGESIEGKIEHFVDDGEDRWVSTTKVPRYDDEGELLGLVGDVRDVTHIKRQERMMATLHEASRRLVRADSREEVGAVAVDIASDIDALPAARVDLVDGDTGTRRTVAAETDDRFEWDPDSFARTVESGVAHYRAETGAFVPVDTDSHDHEDLETPEGIETVSGLRIPLGEHGVLGLDAGEEAIDPFTIELAHVLAANVEATLDRARQQRRLAEQAERLEEFALVGSHELRNRLQIALGNAERARAKDDVEAVDDVVETLGRMNRLVTQLLTLARTGAVSQTTDRVVLGDTADQAWHAIDGPETALTVVDDAIVTADRDSLLEVFEMLFRTLVDGGGSDSVSVGTTADGFFVADDAGAIPADQHEGLFDPTYSAVDGGTGDSLYLVSMIADAHDWRVAVTTDEDGNTRFVFEDVEIQSRSRTSE